MPKAQFGDMLRKARLQQGLSLRQLSSQSGIDHTRLSRMEHGTRPAPGLPQLRRLAEVLGLDVLTLMVSTGTPRDTVEHLLWEERLQQAKRTRSLAGYTPQGHPAASKNEFRAKVISRRGALCVVALGTGHWRVVSFSPSRCLRVRIPPESIQIFRRDPRHLMAASSNTFPADIKKARHAGAVTNLILSVSGVELNALAVYDGGNADCLAAGQHVYVAVSPVAAVTEPFER